MYHSIPRFITMFLLLFSSQAFSQGLIIPDKPDAIITLTDHNVDMNVVDQVATISVKQVFHNNSRRSIQGSYIFPLPKDASVSDFEMHADGKVLKGKVLKEDEARRIYEDIVRRQMDPALLEYIDHQLFQVRIFPIPADKDRSIELRFSSILKREGDLVRLSLPLQGELGTIGRRFPRPGMPMPMDQSHDGHRHQYTPSAGKQLIHVSIRTSQDLKNIYSPTHDVAIHRPNDHEATISYEANQPSKERAFVLYYGVSQEDVGISLLSYRPDNKEDGYFMLLLSPGPLSDETKSIKKDILFVVDVSGSMQGEKIKQAKHALRQCVAKLNPEDRFNIIAFSTTTEQFTTELVNAGEHRDAAITFIDKLEAKGGTNIHQAMLDALASMNGSERSRSIIFLTDGLPTVGETDIKTIIKAVEDKNTRDVKLFTFGVGYDVNTLLLDKIAAGSQALSDYIEPNEPIDKKVTAFFSSIQHPALTQLSLDYGRVKVSDVYPVNIPDLFHGSQVTILGRFAKPRKTAVQLAGQYNGKKKSFSSDADWTDAHADNSFLPHLWATRKIGYLNESIRLNGENQELVDEIVRLSQKYGIMSPYTSYLAEEEMDMANGAPPSPQRPRRKRLLDKFKFRPLAKKSAVAPQLMGVSAGSSTGKEAVRQSKLEREMKEAVAVADEDLSVRRIDNRTFNWRNDMWVDSEFKDQKTLDIQYGSDAYFKLLSKFPQLGKFLALGEKVILKWNESFIRIAEKGKTVLSDKELKSLK